MVNSSSLPNSIRKEHTSLEKSDITEKFMDGPKVPNPGPILPRHVAAAEKLEPLPAPSTTVQTSENRVFPDTDGEPRISKILVFYDNGTYKEIK